MHADTEIKINQGNEAVFKALFHKYYKSVVHFINAYNLGLPESEDIAQEVFLMLWQKELSFPNEIAFKAYMYQSAKHKALNLLEHLSVRNRTMNDIIEKSQSEEFFFHNYIENETNRILMDTIDCLPDRSKQVIQLSLMEQTNREIAEKLELSVNTVKNHKASALKYLKKNLKGLLHQ